MTTLIEVEEIYKNLHRTRVASMATMHHTTGPPMHLHLIKRRRFDLMGTRSAKCVIKVQRLVEKIYPARLGHNLPNAGLTTQNSSTNEWAGTMSFFNGDNLPKDAPRREI